MPVGIFLLQGRTQPAIPRRVSAPSHASALPTGWSLTLSQRSSAAFSPGSAAKAGLPFFIAFGLSASSGVFRRTSHRLCGSACAFTWRCSNRHRWPSPALAGLRQRSFAGRFVFVSAEPLRHLSPRTSAVPSCGIHRLPSTSPRSSFHEHDPYPFVLSASCCGRPSLSALTQQASCSVLSPDHPRATFVCASPVRHSSWKKGGRLIRGNR